MPKNTGIKSSEDYLKRLLEEDKKIAGKDNPYGRYLTSLTINFSCAGSVNVNTSNFLYVCSSLCKEPKS